ncbi:MAG: hemolysin III family protein [Pseudomonadota bacterium]
MTRVRRQSYTRAEYVSDVAVHLAGLVAVAAAVPMLISLASASESSDGRMAAALVYGACFAAMISCSALYNVFPHPDWEWMLQRLDHAAIYVKIAGTYTAFVLVAGHGVALATGLWVAAVIGITLKLIAPQRWRWFAIALYLGMGWSAVVLGWDVFARLPTLVVAMVAGGGLLYTVGVVFHLWDRLPFHNTIWHVFVLAASLLMCASVMTAILA